MSEPVKIICPYCYSPELSMYMEGLSNISAGTLSMPAGNLDNNNMELKCNACGHVFKPAQGKLSQEAGSSTAGTGYSPGATTSLSPDEGHILSLANTHGKLQAIKYCCDTYGWGLKESKDYVDRLTGTGTYDRPAANAASPDQAKVISILQSQGKLFAVKYVKENTGWSLKASKDYVDELAGNRGIAVKPGGCFIATACYGDYDAPEVRRLRQYRDQVLVQSVQGRAFIKLYYALSPPVAHLLSRSDNGRDLVRRYFLAPLLRLIDP